MIFTLGKQHRYKNITVIMNIYLNHWDYPIKIVTKKIKTIKSGSVSELCSEILKEQFSRYEMVIDISLRMIMNYPMN